MSTEDVTFNLEINVEKAFNNLRQIEGLTVRTLSYMQRLGLPEDMNEAIQRIQKVTMALRMLHSAMVALELASGPLGWWRIGLALIGAGLSIGGAINSFDATYDTQRGTS